MHKIFCLNLGQLVDAFQMGCCRFAGNRSSVCQLKTYENVSNLVYIWHFISIDLHFSSLQIFSL